MERRLLRRAADRAAAAGGAKRLGFSDRADRHAGRRDARRRSATRRREWGIRPIYKMVDTCAAEFEAVTPYFYGTYEPENEAPPLPGPKAVVLGSGPIRIGQGIEFDYCSVRAALALRERGVPEHHDQQQSRDGQHRLRRLDAAVLRAAGRRACATSWRTRRRAARPPTRRCVVQFGGQTADQPGRAAGRRPAPACSAAALRAIDVAEDRDLFEDLVDRLGDSAAARRGILTVDRGADAWPHRVGYPVLVRPSFVLGGWAHGDRPRRRGPARATSPSAERDLGAGRPILVDKYLEGREIEVDAICDGEDVLIPGIMEHVERAGVHSGDSIAIYPAAVADRRSSATTSSSTPAGSGVGLGVRGLFNVQYVDLPTTRCTSWRRTRAPAARCRSSAR